MTPLGSVIAQASISNADAPDESTVQALSLTADGSAEIPNAVSQAVNAKKTTGSSTAIDAGASSIAMSISATQIENFAASTPDQNGIPNSPRIGTDSFRGLNDTLSTPAGDSQETVQRLELAAPHVTASTATQPVFTLAIRTDTGQPAISPPEGASSVESTSQAASNIAGAQEQNLSSFVNSSSATPGSIQNTAPNNTVDNTASVMTSAGATPNFVETASDGKSSDDQPGDKQAMAAFVEALVSSGSAAASGTQFQIAESRPVTEYVHLERAENAPGNTPVTDIRLQVDGTANQHVNIRVFQQPDGLHVSVRSNDPALTQSLQERVPELTTRLEQHHYQSEVFLPENSDSRHLNPANPGAHLEQGSSGRDQGSGQQGNSQNKQNQQRQQAGDEQESFANLFAFRR